MIFTIIGVFILGWVFIESLKCCHNKNVKKNKKKK
jgi:hypothetical protein